MIGEYVDGVAAYGCDGVPPALYFGVTLHSFGFSQFLLFN